MIKKTRLSIFIFSLIIVACSHYDSLEKSGEESKADGKSHNAGKDCMSCHNSSSNEASENWRNVAGTIYKSNSPLSNSSVQLWSEPGGKGFKIASLVSDKSGNFYTEKIIDFKGGCYPIAINGTDTLFMDESKYNGGGCNSCHYAGSTLGILNF